MSEIGYTMFYSQSKRLIYWIYGNAKGQEKLRHPFKKEKS